MPYQHKIIQTIQLPPELAWNLEQKLHRIVEWAQYLPKQHFGGRTECYKLENLNEILAIWDREITQLKNKSELL
jgi:hypothetical protein